MKPLYKSSVYCCICFRNAKLNSADKFRAYASYIDNNGCRRTVLKTPAFVCENCCKKFING